MISNELLQDCLHDFSDIMGCEMGLFDHSRGCVAGNPALLPAQADFYDFCDADAARREIPGGCLFRVGLGEVPYVLAAAGEGEEVRRMGRLAVRQLERLMETGRSRRERTRLVSRLLRDDLPGVDREKFARRMRIGPKCRFAVLLVEARGCETLDLEHILENILPGREFDFLVPMEESQVAVLRFLDDGEGEEELRELASIFSDTVSAETLCRVRTGFGTAAMLREAARSYREARTALEVGEIFYSGMTVLSYEHLGIGRLLCQLPVSLCEIFLHEVFSGFDPEGLDEETLSTAHKFMENGLNLTETARQLYIHRNTLVYRLGKLQKLTGLDLRRFEDAVTFKLAMMTADYVKRRKR